VGSIPPSFRAQQESVCADGGTDPRRPGRRRMLDAGQEHTTGHLQDAVPVPCRARSFTIRPSPMLTSW